MFMIAKGRVEIKQKYDSKDGGSTSIPNGIEPKLREAISGVLQGPIFYSFLLASDWAGLRIPVLLKSQKLIWVEKREKTFSQ